VARFGELLGTENVLSGAACLPYALDGHVPAIVVRPGSAALVAAALAEAQAQNLAVAPWGGGTQMTIGYPLQRLDVVLSLEHLKTLQIADPSTRQVTAAAGCTIAEINTALAASGQFLPLDGPLANAATIGGRLATGMPGLQRGRYGHTRDRVVNLVVARSDGMMMHTGGTANRHMLQSTLGYDLNKLFVGSLGTLGIIVEATLRTELLPQYEATVTASFADPDDLWELGEDLAAAQLDTAEVVVCSAEILAAPTRSSVATDRAVLALRLVGTQHDVSRQALTVRELALKYGAAAPVFLHGAASQGIWQALDDFSATQGLTPTEAVIKVAALASESGTVIEMVRSMSAEHELPLRWLADVVTGLVWLHVGEADLGASEDAQARFAAALIALQTALTARWRNAVVLGSAPALRQRMPLWGADLESLELLRTLKQQFDPGRILNPGRFGGRSGRA
jgi:glycolate oxidase FAD binding subunit